jgi:hypothetical protein
MITPQTEVAVRNMDGTITGGTVVAVHDTPVDEWPADFMEADGATLHDFWRGTGVDAGEAVVTVDIDGKEYDYPESRVEVLEKI